MVQAMLKFFHAVEDFILAPQPQQAAEVHRVGEFYADYTPLTPEEMAREDEACAELFKRSKMVSR